jgi:hypothetical protein
MNSSNALPRKNNKMRARTASRKDPQATKCKWGTSNHPHSPAFFLMLRRDLLYLI